MAIPGKASARRIKPDGAVSLQKSSIRGRLVVKAIFVCKRRRKWEGMASGAVRFFSCRLELNNQSDGNGGRPSLFKSMLGFGRRRGIDMCTKLKDSGEHQDRKRDTYR